jgi:hypothetical protein
MSILTFFSGLLGFIKAMATLDASDSESSVSESSDESSMDGSGYDRDESSTDGSGYDPLLAIGHCSFCSSIPVRREKKACCLFRNWRVCRECLTASTIPCDWCKQPSMFHMDCEDYPDDDGETDAHLCCECHNKLRKDLEEFARVHADLLKKYF